MKQIWTYMIVALAGLSLLACNKEKAIEQEILPEKTPVVEEFTYTIAIDGQADTKAVLEEDHMAWQSGDQIGWFTDKAGHSEINMASDPRSFQVSSTAAMAAGAKVYAYAPYTTEGIVTAAPLRIPTAQDGVITNAMPMVSLPIELTAGMNADTNTPMGQASFLGLGAVIEYNVYTSDDTFGAEKVQSVQFASSSNIAGSFTVNLTTVAENAIPAPTGLDQKTVTSTLATATTVGDNKDNGLKVYQVLAPGTWSGTVTVTTDIATYTYTLTDKTFSRGKIKPLNVNLASENAVRIECPYWHTFVCGDWGIGADPTGHPEGDYYMDWGLTNPAILDGASWSWEVLNNTNDAYDAGGYFTWVPNWTLQIGSYSTKISDYILSSSSFPGKITKVTISLEVDSNYSIDISCKVGNENFGSRTITAGDAVFTGSASGEIAITFHSTENTPAWLYYLSIEYEP